MKLMSFYILNVKMFDTFVCDENVYYISFEHNTQYRLGTNKNKNSINSFLPSSQKNTIHSI